MKLSILFSLFIAFSLNCLSQEITKIEILSVPMSTETPSPVSCSNFDSSFRKDIINTTSITNTSRIRDLMLILNNLPSTIPGTYPTPDTRVKVKIYSGEFLASEICIGEFTVLKNNEVFLYSDALMKELDKQNTPQKQQQTEARISFDATKQYKGYLGAAMGIVSFDNNNNFLYEIEGSILNERLTGKFETNGDTINCTIQTSKNQLFEPGDKLKFMIKADSIFQFNSEKKPDLTRPLMRIR
ncbi:MAG: hypothetical protein ACK5KL_15975 [Dysgonomonas sp.]|nr:hypothetical protein [Prevotella sp.]